MTQALSSELMQISVVFDAYKHQLLGERKKLETLFQCNANVLFDYEWNKEKKSRKGLKDLFTSSRLVFGDVRSISSVCFRLLLDQKGVKMTSNALLVVNEPSTNVKISSLPTTSFTPKIYSYRGGQDYTINSRGKEWEITELRVNAAVKTTELNESQISRDSLSSSQINRFTINPSRLTAKELSFTLTYWREWFKKTSKKITDDISKNHPLESLMPVDTEFKVSSEDLWRQAFSINSFYLKLDKTPEGLIRTSYQYTLLTRVGEEIKPRIVAGHLFLGIEEAFGVCEITKKMRDEKEISEEDQNELSFDADTDEEIVFTPESPAESEGWFAWGTRVVTLGLVDLRSTASDSSSSSSS